MKFRLETKESELGKHIIMGQIMPSDHEKTIGYVYHQSGAVLRIGPVGDRGHYDGLYFDLTLRIPLGNNEEGYALFKKVSDKANDLYGRKIKNCRSDYARYLSRGEVFDLKDIYDPKRQLRINPLEECIDYQKKEKSSKFKKLLNILGLRGDSQKIEEIAFLNRFVRDYQKLGAVEQRIKAINEYPVGHRGFRELIEIGKEREVIESILEGDFSILENLFDSHKLLNQPGMVFWIGSFSRYYDVSTMNDFANGMEEIKKIIDCLPTFGGGFNPEFRKLEDEIHAAAGTVKVAKGQIEKFERKIEIGG